MSVMTTTFRSCWPPNLRSANYFDEETGPNWCTFTLCNMHSTRHHSDRTMVHTLTRTV